MRVCVDLPRKNPGAPGWNSPEREKEVMLNRNFKRVNDEVKAMINELLGKTSDE